MSKYENDLISKGDLLSALCDKYIYDDRIPVLPPDFLVALRETQRFIRDFPTIDHDSLRPHGRRLNPSECGGNVFGPCSICGAWYDVEHGTDDGLFLYCPHCGAKMED